MKNVEKLKNPSSPGKPQISTAATEVNPTLQEASNGVLESNYPQEPKPQGKNMIAR